MEHTIEIDGVTMHYHVHGNGPQPVIVMHGWGCNASTVRLMAQAAESDKTTVYNLDLPGFGASAEPPQTWDIFDYAHFVEAFAAKLGLDKPALIGHSFGGRIGIVFAAERPVSKLILVDAAGVKPRRSLRYYAKVYSFKTAKKLLPLLLGAKKATRVIDSMRSKAGSADYNSASTVMRRIMSTVVNQDLKKLMPAIQCPTLLIWGQKDTATPLSDAKTMERLIPDAGLVVYPGAGHFSFLEHPGQTTAVIKNFLNL